MQTWVLVVPTFLIIVECDRPPLEKFDSAESAASEGRKELFPQADAFLADDKHYNIYLDVICLVQFFRIVTSRNL